MTGHAGIRALFIALGCVVAALPTTSAQSLLRPFAPVDEAATQPGFFTFRAQLQTAIARHDRAALMAVVNEKIRNTFGDDNGSDAFERRWRLSEANSEVWGELGRVLALGGSFDQGGNFVAPYVYSEWPDDLDAFAHVAIVGDRVRVRAAANVSAPAIGSVSFVIVPLVPTKETRGQWTAVRLANGRTGFVSSSYARSSVGYRAFFSRLDGHWQMTSFVAGD